MPTPSSTDLRTKIVLADQATMARNFGPLMSDHERVNLLPHFLQYAGERKIAQGLALMTEMAVANYTQGLPSAIAAVVDEKKEDYIDALVKGADVPSARNAGEADAIRHRVGEAAKGVLEEMNSMAQQVSDPGKGLGGRTTQAEGPRMQSDRGFGDFGLG